MKKDTAIAILKLLAAAAAAFVMVASAIAFLWWADSMGWPV